MIYYGHQHITNEDIAAVREVLTSDFLTQGPAVARFERSVADYCGGTAVRTWILSISTIRPIT